MRLIASPPRLLRTHAIDNRPLTTRLLLLAGYCLLSTSFVPAQTYTIQKDQFEKEGRLEDRFFVGRQPDALGKTRLFVTIQFKVLEANGEPALHISPEEVLVTEDGKPVGELQVQTPAAKEVLTTVLAIDTSGSMADHGKMT